MASLSTPSHSASISDPSPAESGNVFVIPLPQGSAPPTVQDDSQLTVLKDFMSRLARFGAGVRAFAASSRSERREPVNAFMEGGRPGYFTPSASSPSTPDPTTTASHGFSLVDLETWVMDSAEKWWRGEGGEVSTPAPGHLHRTDSEGLDIDLSVLFRDQAARARAGEPLDALAKHSSPGRFLNYYTPEALIHLLDTCGILEDLRARGYSHLSFVFDTSDDFQHRLSLVDASLFAPELHLLSSERFLIDLYMKRRRIWGSDLMACYQLMNRLQKAGSWEALRALTGEIRAPYVGVEGAKEVTEFFDTCIPKFSKLAKKGTGEWDVSEIAWMQMHDPSMPITRPLLPGQRFPGLGLGRKVSVVMENMAGGSKVTDALVNFPFHYHNAVAYYPLGYRHLDPIYEAYVAWLTSQIQPTIALHGFCFIAWCVSMGHLRRITEQRPASSPSGPWKRVSSRLERWSPSEQIFPTGPGTKAFLESKEWKRLYDKYEAVFRENGGANMEGVGVVEKVEGTVRRATLVIDLEGCPELWKYSNVWKNRDPETGAFR